MVRHKLRRVLALSVMGACFAFGLAACGTQTSFSGSPRFPGGARACFDKCATLNMEMATFVYVGEYSTACACKPVKTPGQAEVDDGAQAATVAAAAGVEMERRRREEEARRAAAAQAAIKH